MKTNKKRVFFYLYFHKEVLMVCLVLFALLSCKTKELASGENGWTKEKLELKSKSHSDTVHWDQKLYRQDIVAYQKYAEAFAVYPLNKTPFPVAEYDYAVASAPFSVRVKKCLFKGIRIGEYENPDSETIKECLTLLVLTNDEKAEESTLVESRNYPYLTAQGYFKTVDNQFDWIFSKSPDGFSTLMVNMKLFDLRFGEIVVIVPQTDKSFVYCQLKDSFGKYKSAEDFEAMLSGNKKILDLLSRKQTLGNSAFRY